MNICKPTGIYKNLNFFLLCNSPIVFFTLQGEPGVGLRGAPGPPGPPGETKVLHGQGSDSVIGMKGDKVSLFYLFFFFFSDQ